MDTKRASTQRPRRGRLLGFAAGIVVLSLFTLTPMAQAGGAYYYPSYYPAYAPVPVYCGPRWKHGHGRGHWKHW